jgi:hypothetical protein
MLHLPTLKFLSGLLTVVSLEGLYSKNMAMSQHFSNNLKVKLRQPTHLHLFCTETLRDIRIFVVARNSETMNSATSCCTLFLPSIIH